MARYNSSNGWCHFLSPLRAIKAGTVAVRCWWKDRRGRRLPGHRCSRKFSSPEIPKGEVFFCFCCCCFLFCFLFFLSECVLNSLDFFQIGENLTFWYKLCNFSIPGELNAPRFQTWSGEECSFWLYCPTAVRKTSLKLIHVTVESLRWEESALRDVIAWLQHQGQRQTHL